MASFSKTVHRDDPFHLEMELGDYVVVCFKPVAHFKDYKSFSAATLLLPNGRLALKVTFLESFVDEQGVIYLFDESVGADEVTLWKGTEQEVKLVKRVRR